MPTHTPLAMFVRPTLRPDQKVAKPQKRAMLMYFAKATGAVGKLSGSFIFPARIIAKIMP
jgi:hypothetical protein